jgi:hypothetical protein
VQGQGRGDRDRRRRVAEEVHVHVVVVTGLRFEGVVVASAWRVIQGCPARRRDLQSDTHRTFRNDIQLAQKALNCVFFSSTATHGVLQKCAHEVLQVHT